MKPYKPLNKGQTRGLKSCRKSKATAHLSRALRIDRKRSRREARRVIEIEKFMETMRKEISKCMGIPKPYTQITNRE